ncbi:transmembrane protein 106B-like isoform X1 [Denticeps clupeoides]|uniref:Transmembrane protein 106B n=1 Tax=Denticeps clupeoides TaxID=299321 RepID=A0AAY4DDB7_9TELE|nr:transmembrane protein 106B-like isoform X1 [Denticeps clupeoides]
MVPPRHAVLQKQEAGTTRESVSRLGQRGQRGHAPLRSSLVSMGASQSQRAEDTGPILAQEETPKSQERQASADTVNCPTCQGTGRIPRGQEDKLVAVIPCTDQRLRPRHTKFYVCLSVGVCLLISGLVLFFLFPRSVSLSDLAVNSAYVVFTPAATNITIFNSLNISNDNFATVEASELDVRVFYLETVVGSTKVANVTKVKPRSEKMYNFEVFISLTDIGINKYCKSTSTKIRIIFFKLQISMTVFFLAHYEQLSLDTFEYIDCGTNTTTPHVSSRSK